MADYFRKYFRLPCEDGVTRSIRVRCHCFDGSMAADTYFSVPADAVIHGVYVTGYVGNIANSDVDGVLGFRVHNSGLAKLPVDKRDSFRGALARGV